MKKDIKSLSLSELGEEMAKINEKSFRAKQIYKWLHKENVKSFDMMTDLSKDLRKKLDEEYFLNTPEIADMLESAIDGTRKYLFKLYDDIVIESVFMRYHHGNSVCISTQAGCRMGCRFCASTLNGLERNLEVSELLGQIYEIEKSTGESISNIVLMGSGEPLDNYDNVVKFLGMISDENGRNISQRNITVSTCGLVPKIIKLADEDLKITLAISLHASDDETRKELMPVANSYSIEEILNACRYYFDKTGRRVSFEYSLVAGVNDTEAEAKKLSTLLAKMNCHVNLIPVNPIKERDYKQSDRRAVEHFLKVLEKNGINGTIRREMGRDISGACGQLRKSYMDKKE